MDLRRTAPLLLAILVIVPVATAQDGHLWVGPNVNMVSGTTFPDGDPFLQRQNEPSAGVSTRNPLHILAGANDYRAVDIPGLPEGKETGDSWLGVFESVDGGSSWHSYLMPGYPQDSSDLGMASPLKGYDAGADPVVRAGTDGLFYYAGIVFLRENLAESAIFVARFEDLNNDERGDPIAYLDTQIVATGSGDLFVDKPWMAVDKPRGGAQCGNVYVAWAEIDGSGVDPTSRIMFSSSADCGVSWASPIQLSTDGTLPQGSTISVAPDTGDVYVAWRQHTSLQTVNCVVGGGGFWKNSPELWPVESITMGGVTYSKSEAIAILGTPPRGDATYILARQLIPAKLNYLSSSVSSTIQLVIEEADEWLMVNTLGSKPKGAAKQEGLAIKDDLESYNDGEYADGDSIIEGCEGTVSSESDAIVVVESTDDGVSFGSPVEVSELSPFDQGTSAYSFRSTSYPTMTADESGLVYLAWTTRGFGTGGADPNTDTGDARIVVSVSDNGLPWTAPQPIDRPEVPGHQIKPSLTYTGGKLLLTYYDFRRDVSDVFDRFVADWPSAVPTPRHTVDVRAAVAQPGASPIFTDYTSLLASTQASRYAHFIGGEGQSDAESVQLEYNAPNMPMFKGGTVPFFSDYLDIAPSPPFVPDGYGGWDYNTDPDNASVTHVVWTDDRDVVGPADGDWTSYIPPTHANSGGASIFDPNQTVPVCDPQTADVDRTRMRNQNIYTARLTEGLYVAVPGNSRPLGSVPGSTNGDLLQRAFVVFVQNATEVERSFELSIFDQPQAGEASFQQFELEETAYVTIEAYSSASRTVFVKSSVEGPPWPSVEIDVTEIDYQGDAPLHSTVLINPDPWNPPPAEASLIDGEIYNPSIWNPSIWNPSIWNPSIWNPSIWNPSIWNPSIWNPSIWNPSIWNPSLVNPSIWNPSIWNPSIWNPSIWNPSIWNPAISNPSIWNPSIWNPSIWNTSVSEVTDVTWMVKNDGNATAAYSFNLLADQVPADHAFQLMVYRVYTTPVADGCELTVEGQQETLVNILDPDFTAPDLLDPNTMDPDVPTFFLGPGEEVFITLRVHDPDQTDDIDFRPEEVQVAVVAQGVETEVVLDGGDQQPYAIPDISVPISSPMEDGRMQHTTTPLADGTILIVGGYNDGGTLDTAEIFDPVSRSFVAVPDFLGSPRAYHTATELNDGTVLIVGGSSSAPGAEIYDPVSQTFTQTIGEVQVFRGGHQATLLHDGRVLITGGNAGVTPVNSAEVYDPTDGSFTLVGSMSSARWEHSATMMSTGEVLVAGGYDGVADLDTAELFDPTTDSFSVVPGAMTDARRFHSGTLLPDGTVLLAGGLFDSSLVANASADIYDRSTNSLIPAGSLIRARAAHTATLLADGKVLLTGGQNMIDGSLSLSSHIELYDWSTGSFIEKGHMTIARSEHQAVRMPDGKVLLTGGATYGAPITTGTDIAELYVPAKPAKFRVIGNLATGRLYHTVTTLSGGDVLIAGGVGDDLNVVATIERFSPATGQITTVANMPTGRNAPSATLLDDGSVLIAGGSPDDGTTVLDTAMIYDPGDHSLTPTVGDLGTARMGHAATLLQDGRVLIVAGNSSGGVPLAGTEIYDPATGTFSPSDSLSTARRHGSGVSLHDGRVLVAGGRTTGTGATAAFQLWDPTTETFGPEGLMNDSRRSYRYTLLNDGTVLIAGGVDDGGVWLDSAEIFDPTTDTFNYTAGTMRLRRRSHTQVLLPSGEVLLAGGMTEGSILLSYAEIYDPITQSFRLTDIKTGPRSGTRPVRLADGRVLIVGGLSLYGPVGLVPTSLVEVYNPWDTAFGGMAVFTSQPKDVPIGGILSPTIQVAVFDDDITPIAGVSVGLQLEDSFGGADTTWIQTANANGIAIFDNVWFDRIGAGRRLIAQVESPGPDLNTGPSSPFEVLPLVVTNTRDDGPGSIRRAIENANRNVGYHDTVSFNTAGPTPHSIAVTSELPYVSDPVTIDGTSHPQYVDEPIVYLDGGAAGPDADGLRLYADGTEVRGLGVVNFTDNGFYVASNPGMRIEDNYIGTDGATAMSNDRAGIFASQNSGAVIAGNLVSGNGDYGVVLADCTGVLVDDNRIGINLTGDAAIPNGSDGVLIYNPGSNGIIVSNNLISGNGQSGVSFYQGAHDNTVIGNLIGTDESGTSAVPNIGYGVLAVESSGITIGGTSDAERNVISGNGRGVDLYLAEGNTIIGNYIGTDVDGDEALPNADLGVYINESDNNTVGGTSSDARNVISGNIRDGVRLRDAEGNTIAGNFIGIDVNEISLPNTETGIHLQVSSSNIVGGPFPTDRNVVSGNNHFGVRIAGGSLNVVEGNRTGTNAEGTAIIPNGRSNILVDVGATNNFVINNLASGASQEGIEIVDAVNTTITGNYVGTDSTGELPLGNTTQGIAIYGNSTGTIVGGPTLGDGNVISANGQGIAITAPASNSVIEGNYIGTDKTATDAIGNNLGIFINGADDTILRSNVIAGNFNSGVLVEENSDQTALVGNWIGTNSSIFSGIGNGDVGVEVWGSSVGTVIGTSVAGNTIAYNNTTGPTTLGGLAIWYGGSVHVEGNTVSANNGHGIFLHRSDSITVSENKVGTDASGAVDLGNTLTGLVVNDSDSSTISGNVISGNGGPGIEIEFHGSQNVIRGNYIGTNAAGDTALPNSDGIVLDVGIDTIIGGSLPGQGNIIAGNWGRGVDNRQSSTGTIIEGNYIGTNSSMISGIGNDDGVFIFYPAGHVIGGSDPDAGNLIAYNRVGIDVRYGGALEVVNNVVSGNTVEGIYLYEVDGATISGNMVGTDPTGMFDRGNEGIGIGVWDSNDVIVTNNLISGNDGTGLYFDGTYDSSILGNQIGTDYSGSSGLPNQTGIELETHSRQNQIGGSGAGEANTIAFNLGSGIAFSGTVIDVQNSIISNSIHSNGGLGIDLYNDGVTTNDAGDLDVGPNGLLNFPIVSSAVDDGLFTAVSGTIGGKAGVFSTFQLHLYSNSSCDSSTFGEGETLVYESPLWSLAPSATFNWSVSLPTGLAGSFLTATATAEEGTSEFSQCLLVTTP